MTAPTLEAPPGVEVRGFEQTWEVRAEGDGRTVYGIAVPYGVPMRIHSGLVEEFERGAFAHQVNAAHRVKYAREHLGWFGGELIGRATLMREDASGLYIEMRVSRTNKGDETLELIRDGALSHLSIGFRRVQDRIKKSDRWGEITVRVKAQLVEVASVIEGAYGDHAAAEGIRTAGGLALGEPEILSSTPNLDRAAQLIAGLPPLPAPPRA